MGFFDGVGAFVQGAGFVVRRPSLWGWAAVPVICATVLTVGLGSVALWGAAELATRWLAAPDGTTASGWLAFGIVAVRVVLSLIGMVVAFLVATTLAQPLSGFALDAIARSQELALGGRRWPEQRGLGPAARSFFVTLTALAVTLPLLALLSLVTFAFPPASVVTIPLKFLVTGMAVAYDFLDYPLSLRGQGVGGRLAFIRRHLAGVVGFGVAGAVLLLVPGIGLFLLPFGVAGAARFVVTAEPSQT
jgi:CysZ protein